MSYHKLKGDNLPERSENDFYETPLNIAQSFLKVIYEEFLENWFEHFKQLSRKEIYVLDVGAGTGVWGGVIYDLITTLLPDKDLILDGVEIDPEFEKPWYYTNWYNEDALTWENEKKYDLIIGNPPFGIINDLVARYPDWMRESRYNRSLALFLAPNTFLNSKARYDLFFSPERDLRNFELTEMVIPSGRINYVGKGEGNPRTEFLYIFSFFTFDSYLISNIINPDIMWIRDWNTEEGWGVFLDSLNKTTTPTREEDVEELISQLGQEVRGMVQSTTLNTISTQSELSPRLTYDGLQRVVREHFSNRSNRE